MPKQEPASIRYKNPGAMWGSPLAIKWGANKKPVVLKDGKGQGNNIAVFPTYVQGICAQLDLWRTSKNYRNKRFSDAIAIWAGRNNVESYIKFVLARVPGMTRNTVMNDAFWNSPKGIAFLKAQAWHEAGKRYPAPDADWLEAQEIVFNKDKAMGMAPAEPEPDDTRPHEAPADAPKTGISEGAKIGAGLSITGILATIWEKLAEAPDSLLQAAILAASKPTFWLVGGAVGACIYIWVKRSNMKKSA
jgi:hypothetical protein